MNSDIYLVIGVFCLAPVVLGIILSLVFMVFSMIKDGYTLLAIGFILAFALTIVGGVSMQKWTNSRTSAQPKNAAELETPVEAVQAQTKNEVLE